LVQLDYSTIEPIQISEDRTAIFYQGLLSTIRFSSLYLLFTVFSSWTDEDVIGSPYAIRNYTVNPAIGTKANLITFRNRLSTLGIQLFVDLVPNHSAVDMSSVSTNMSLYIRAPPSLNPPYDPKVYLPNGVAYGRDPYSGAWTDTAQYNLWDMNMRSQLTSFLLTCAEVADGVRCDMAMLLINDVINQTWHTQLDAWNYKWPATEYWRDAVSTVKQKYPSFTFLAEVYWGREQQLLDMGFDFMYDKDGLYNRLADGNLDNLRSYVRSTDFTHLTHFTENHDEDRAIAHFGGIARANAATVVSMTLPGMRFYFMGQTEGKANKLDVHLRRSADEAVNDEVVKFYAALQASLRSSVFHTGRWMYQTVRDEDGTSWRLMSWKWKEGTNKRLIEVNYSDQYGSGRILCDDAGENAHDDTVTLRDELNDATYERSVTELKTQGLFVTLEPWKAHIFNY
jgi:hypothetical protein